MKKLFKFFILVAMALAIILPFNKPETVHAGDGDTIPSKTLALGETIQEKLDDIISDPSISDEEDPYNIKDRGKVSVVPADSSIITLSDVKITEGKPFAYLENSKPWRTASISFKVTAKKSGRTYVKLIYNGQDYGYLSMYKVGNSIAMFRLYNPNSGEHFYTSNIQEKNNLIRLGWRDENVGWYAPATGKPVYRLYNENGGEHHYTLDVNERNNLIKAGWKDEKIGWYSDPNETVKVYRQYNPNAFANNHNYTTNVNEKDHLLSLGWKDEKIGWYGVNK